MTASCLAQRARPIYRFRSTQRAGVERRWSETPASDDTQSCSAELWGACCVLAIRKPTSPGSRGRGGRAAGSIRCVTRGGSHDRLGRSGFRGAAPLAGDDAGLPRRPAAAEQGDALSRRPASCRGDRFRMRQVAEERRGWRLRGLIVVLWRAGLRVQEALALGERDLDPHRGSLLVRHGKGGRRREIGMDALGWEQLSPWLAARVELPVGPLFCIIDGPTRGRPWSSAAVRSELRRLAVQKLSLIHI